MMIGDAIMIPLLACSSHDEDDDDPDPDDDRCMLVMRMTGGADGVDGV